MPRSPKKQRQNKLTGSALEALVTNVMIADQHLNITYVNPSLAAMLQTAEADIRKDLPAFSARDIIGRNIDEFHKNPAHQRGALAGLTGTHRAQIKIGGRSFALTVTPLFDTRRKRVGSVVEWVDRTEQVTVEAQIEGEILHAVDAASAGDLSQRIRSEGKPRYLVKVCENINSLLGRLQQVNQELN
jgi:methyl-accepting chemotaxis protein